MIRRIQASTYRCYNKLDVSLDAYQVLVGPNGSGKTTLLEIPTILSAMIETSPQEALLSSLPGGKPPYARTLNEVVYRRQGEAFSLALEADLPEYVQIALQSTMRDPNRAGAESLPKRIRYEVELRIFNDLELQIDSEHLRVLSSQPVSRQPKRWSIIERIGETTYVKPEDFSRRAADQWNLRPTELAFSSIPRARNTYPAANYLRELLRSEVASLELSLSSLRRASPPGVYETIDSSGTALPWLVQRLIQLRDDEGDERFDAWLERVKEALPRIEDVLVVERNDDHHAYLQVVYAGGFTVSSSGLSEGTLRILALTLLPYLDRTPEVLVIEEPENTIHPQAVSAVSNALSSLSNSQVWVTTHSPVFVSQTQVSDLLIAQSLADGVELTPGPRHNRLIEWKKDARTTIGLGTLFASGVLS